MAGLPQPADQLRNSHGLEQFFSTLGPQPGQRVLDLGEFTQANVTYITSLGHRLYSEDLQQTLDQTFGKGDPALAQSDPRHVQQFLDQVLQFPEEHFDAVLVWDTLERLSRPILDVVMERLFLVLRPEAPLLACFHAESREDSLPCYGFRIADGKSLQMRAKGRRKLAQSFNNRGIEKLFERFHSIKFFLTRDLLREVIVRR
ncbi:MAG: class I SAM-dependent methyltransferase [Acidobacteriia bacterium]|nr:class I SAM-dependent methyltransferase [Terriglobia bacterium]